MRRRLDSRRPASERKGRGQLAGRWQAPTRNRLVRDSIRRRTC